MFTLFVIKVETLIFDQEVRRHVKVHRRTLREGVNGSSGLSLRSKTLRKSPQWVSDRLTYLEKRHEGAVRCIGKSIINMSETTHNIH